MAVAAHHPCGVPYGYEMYYLNVMAGPIRKWRYENHPDHDWIWQRDNASRASVRLGSDTAADLSVGAASRQNAGVLARFSAFRRVIPAERR